MSHGFSRRPYQVLPESREKITCVQINDHGFATHDWFMESIGGWQMPNGFFGFELSIYMEKGSWDRWVRRDWDFVLVAPLISVRTFWAGNDGMQAWRHRRSGYVVPDHCRQTGGCPEIWNSSDIKGKRELKIANLGEVESYVVLNHKISFPRGAWFERSPRGLQPTSLL